MKRLLIVVMLAGSPIAAQSSQFGLRGLGLPGRGLSVASLGTGGSMGLFDGRSSRNPAAPGLLGSASFVFTSTQAWRTSENPAGEGSTREHRFPHLLVGGPIPGVPLAAALSYSSYAARDHIFAAAGVDSPRGTPVDVIDSLGSTGGINDLRLAVAWTPAEHLVVGAGMHFLTGSNRLFSNRSWADTSYLPLRQEAEVTYTGFGVSAGLIYSPSSRIYLAGTIRQDGSLDVRRDSVPAGEVDLPLTLSVAGRLRVTTGMALSAQFTTQNWSVANRGIVESGGVGARNTIEVAAGLELLGNVRRPDHLPLRVGVRHAQLPFMLGEGSQPRELGVSLGTGLRFARDQGGIDLALERIQRSQGSLYSESAWQLSVGVSLRGIASGF
ncbi:MAG TPA: hypothetical protein PLL69_02310 [Gemmatimonadales bacterium]|nr:hypothetical protein [Gemmatimonadales bacterium]